MTTSSNVFASATSDGIVTPDDVTNIPFRALFISEGVTATIVVSRDGGKTSSSPYVVSGPYVLPVGGNRVMATGTSIAGGDVIWMDW